MFKSKIRNDKGELIESNIKETLREQLTEVKKKKLQNKMSCFQRK